MSQTDDENWERWRRWKNREPDPPGRFYRTATGAWKRRKPRPTRSPGTAPRITPVTIFKVLTLVILAIAAYKHLT